MKKLLIAGCILSMPFTNYAQFSDFLNRAKAKVNTRINNKADQAVDKTLDRIEGKVTEPPKTQPVKETKSAASQPATAAVVKEEVVVEKPATITSYSKFDFVPGEKIIYAEDFSQDAAGELPVNWNASGKGEVMTLEGKEGKWLRAFQNNTYLSGITKPLDENFT